MNEDVHTKKYQTHQLVPVRKTMSMQKTDLYQFSHHLYSTGCNFQNIVVIIKQLWIFIPSYPKPTQLIFHDANTL